jgi:alkylmercury lyase
MTAEKTTPSLDATDAALTATTPGLDQEGQRLAAAVLRLLSAGEPVPIAAAAAAARMPVSQAELVLRSWPAVFWDDHGRVTGFWGLALAEMPHRIGRAGVDLYAWCAWDPLFLAHVIGDLQVTTADPVTGEAITYRVGPGGAITGASHPGSVLSFLHPGQPWDDEVMTAFCHYVLHFTGPASAERWVAAHPGTFVISLGDTAELARRHAARAFGAVSGWLGRGPSCGRSGGPGRPCVAAGVSARRGLGHGWVVAALVRRKAPNSATPWPSAQACRRIRPEMPGVLPAHLRAARALVKKLM